MTMEICTTCITSACTDLNIVDFPVVFLDEASMSTEPASLIPIMKGVKQAATDVDNLVNLLFCSHDMSLLLVTISNYRRLLRVQKLRRWDSILAFSKG
jgi:AAA domain